MSNENRIDYVKHLNELFGPVIEDVEKDLNKWSFGDPNPWLEPGNIYRIPVLGSLGTATKVSRTTEAFNLINPVTGMIKDQSFKREDLGDTIVIRRVFGYTATIRSLENKDPSVIKPLLKEMVMTLIREQGFSPDKLNNGIYGTFKRPGENGYFRECESHAGFEIRLFSQTTLAEDVK